MKGQNYAIAVIDPSFVSALKKEKRLVKRFNDFNLSWVVAHEIGHALMGKNHSSEPENLMMAGENEKNTHGSRLTKTQCNAVNNSLSMYAGK